jgi:hypothetical protein
LQRRAALLAELMQRSDPSLRRAAVESLVRIRNATALDALQRALGDVDREVRIAAVRGIGVLRYAPARVRLEELLESRTMKDADLTEKIAFFEAYGSIANAESVNLLDRMLNGRKLLGKETPGDTCVRRHGARPCRLARRAVVAARNPRRRQPHGPLAVLKALRQENAVMNAPLVQSDSALQPLGRSLVITLYAAAQSLRIYPLENATVQKSLDELTASCGGCWSARACWNCASSATSCS